jgi:hypothetical protein
MNRNRILFFALIVQIVLALFAPPISVGERLLFPADLWAFLWVPIAGVVLLKDQDSKERKIFLGSLSFLFWLFALVLIHGRFRPEFTPEFLHFVGGENATTSFAKETVVAFRFFLWCAAALVVSHSDIPFVRLQRGLAVCAALAAAVSVAARIFPELHSVLGTVYHYDPGVSPWAGRIYGVFRSPIEGCVTLCFAFLLLLRGNWASFRVKATSLAVIGSAIVLTKTLGGIIGLMAALAYLVAHESNRRDKSAKRLGIGLTVGVIVVAGIAVAEWNSEFVALKRANLIFRLKPWALYLNEMTSRIDLFLFGTGFHPHFSDDIYLFFFSRGGALLLGSALFGLVHWWKQGPKSGDPSRAAIPIFFLVSGLVVDNLILRPVAYLFIACAIRALQGPKSTSQA